MFCSDVFFCLTSLVAKSQGGGAVRSRQMFRSQLHGGGWWAGKLVGWLGWLGWITSNKGNPLKFSLWKLRLWYILRKKTFWKLTRKPQKRWWFGLLCFSRLSKGAFSGCLAVGCRELFLNLGGWIPYPPKKQLESSGSRLQIQCLWRKFAVQKTVGTLCYFGGFLLYTDPRCFNLIYVSDWGGIGVGNNIPALAIL